MPYTPTNWVEGVTTLGPTNMNKIESELAFLDARIPAAALSYGTTLPGSPVDGQEAILVDSVTAPTYQWRFRYNAGGGTYKWEFVGGSPLASEVYTLESTASGTYVDLTTVGPQVTLPRSGDYDFHFGASGFSSTSATTGLRVAVKIAAIATTDNESLVISSNVASFEQSSARWLRMPGRTASDVCKLQYLTTAAVSASFRRRWLHCLPLRVS